MALTRYISERGAEVLAARAKIHGSASTMVEGRALTVTNY
jgi:hypothetical protein